MEGMEMLDEVVILYEPTKTLFVCDFAVNFRKDIIKLKDPVLFPSPALFPLIWILLHTLMNLIFVRIASR